MESALPFSIPVIITGFVALWLVYAFVSFLIIYVYCADVTTALTPSSHWDNSKKDSTKPAFKDDSVIWITGAGSGLGERLAYLLAKTTKSSSNTPNDNVNIKLILSSRKVEHLERVATECRRLSKQAGVNDISFQVQTLQLDLSDLSSIPEKVRQAQDLFAQKIDVVINAAGVTTRSYSIDSNFALDAYVTNVNYLGPVCLFKTLMKDETAATASSSRSLSIIQLGSVASKMGVPVRSAYCGAKFALQGWLEANIIESVIQGRDVYILNCILGSIDTGLGGRALVDVHPETGKVELNQETDQNLASGLDPGT